MERTGGFDAVVDGKGKIRDRIRFVLEDLQTPGFRGSEGIPVGAELFLVGVKLKAAFHQDADLDKFGMCINTDSIGFGFLDRDTVPEDDSLVTGSKSKISHNSGNRRRKNSVVTPF